jgi:hypothetical protein
MTSVGGIGSVCSGTVVDSALYGRIRKPPLNGRIRSSSSMAFRHVDTVDGARRETAFAARALCFDNRMHELRKPQDSIDGARTTAEVTANALRFVDRRNSVEACLAELSRDGLRIFPEKLCKLSNSRITAWRAKVDCGCAVDERLRVRSAARVPALPALNSWQGPFDSIGGCITLVGEESVAE